MFDTRMSIKVHVKVVKIRVHGVAIAQEILRYAIGIGREIIAN